MPKKIYRTQYTSEIDNFLREYDKKHPEITRAREPEIKKHLAIATKRDRAVEEESSFIWKNF